MAGMIAAGGPETAVAGAAMLAAGGNAVDAAVAAAFVSFIAEVGVVHSGGSGIAHLYDPHTGQSVVYDFFSNTPGLNGVPPSPMDFAKVVVDFGAATQDFYLGRAAVAVPGNFMGLCQMAADYGRLPLPQLLQPAIKLAREGTAIEPLQADTCALLAPLYTHTKEISRIFAPNGRIIQPGEHLFIPNLAETLTSLAEEGEGLLRHGRLAQTLVQDQQQHGGLLTLTDLQSYEVHKLPPIRLPYREYEVLLPPPSSTGGVLTAFSLNLLARFDMAAFQRGSSQHLRLLYEIMVATNRARPFWEQWSTDLPAHEAVARFLADGFIRPYFEEIDELLHGRQAGPLTPEPPAPTNTSHLSVIDGRGLAVSLTTTAGESAGYVLPGTGFIPNNMMGEEDLHPNGFHTRQPGTRLPTMMTPAIILKNGMTRLVVGSGGSIRIRSAILQVLNNLLDYEMALADAVNAPRVHVENGALQCEAGYNPQAVDELEAQGYRVNRWDRRSIYFGGAHSVMRLDDGRLAAAGDSRRGGAVAAV